MMIAFFLIFVFLMMRLVGKGVFLRAFGFIILALLAVVIFAPDPPPDQAAAAVINHQFEDGWCAGYTWSIREARRAGYNLPMPRVDPSTGMFTVRLVEETVTCPAGWR